jgi:hypothetical protein
LSLTKQQDRKQGKMHFIATRHFNKNIDLFSSQRKNCPNINTVFPKLNESNTQKMFQSKLLLFSSNPFCIKNWPNKCSLENMLRLFSKLFSAQFHFASPPGPQFEAVSHYQQPLVPAHSTLAPHPSLAPHHFTQAPLVPHVHHATPVPVRTHQLPPALPEPHTLPAECFIETPCTRSCGDGFKLLLPNPTAYACYGATLQVKFVN